MFNNNYGFPNFNNSFPTATQPYGFPMQQQMQQPIQQQSQSNIIYVNGIDDVKNRPLPPNSNYAFMDNEFCNHMELHRSKTQDERRGRPCVPNRIKTCSNRNGTRRCLAHRCG